MWLAVFRLAILSQIDLKSRNVGKETSQEVISNFSYECFIINREVKNLCLNKVLMLSAIQIVSETWGRDFAHKLLATELQARYITQLKEAHLFGFSQFSGSAMAI